MNHLDEANFGVEGFLKISDLNTGEILVDKKNAIHFGNLTSSVADVLSGIDSSHLRFLAFGNGGTQVFGSSDQSTLGDGTVIYKQPNVGKRKNFSDTMHNFIYAIELNYTDPNNRVTSVGSNSEYADIILEAVLHFDDISAHQSNLDRASSNDDYGIVDEIAIYTGASTSDDRYYDLGLSAQHLMATHVIFHPIQKSSNRSVKIDYVIRVYLVANKTRSDIPTTYYKKPDPLSAQKEFSWSPFMDLVDTVSFGGITYVNNNVPNDILPTKVWWNQHDSRLTMQFFREYPSYGTSGNGNGFLSIEVNNGMFGQPSGIAYYSNDTRGFYDLDSVAGGVANLTSSGAVVKYDFSTNGLSLVPISDGVRTQVAGSYLYRILGDGTDILVNGNVAYLHGGTEFNVRGMSGSPVAISATGPNKDFVAILPLDGNVNIETNGCIIHYVHSGTDYYIADEIKLPMDFSVSKNTVISKFNDYTFLATTTGGSTTKMVIFKVEGGSIKILHYIGSGYARSTEDKPSAITAISPNFIAVTDSVVNTVSVYKVRDL